MYSSNLSFSKTFSVSVAWNILCMLCQLKVHNIIKEPGRMNVPGMFKLSAFVVELLIFAKHTLTNKKSFRKT